MKRVGSEVRAAAKPTTSAKSKRIKKSRKSKSDEANDKRKNAAATQSKSTRLPETAVTRSETATSISGRLAKKLGRQLGSFRMTYYWVAQQRTRKRSTALYTRGCKRVAKVSRRFARDLIMEGTGRLLDGRVVNVAGPCRCATSPCVMVLGKKYPFGVGSASRPLSPFRSVAVDPRRIPIGKTLYVPELDGLTMPGAGKHGGFVHDGCVVADDRGAGIRGLQIDFFVARKAFYDALNRRHRIRKVTVYDGKGRCDTFDESAARRNHGS